MNSAGAVVDSVNERLELKLADGRTLRLSGIEAANGTPSDPDLGVPGQDWLTAWLDHQEIRFALLDVKPDRWGRWPANVFAAPRSGEPGLASVTEILLQQGFARVVPDQLKNPCEDRLLQAEQKARAAGRGLWNDPYYAVVAATDASSFAEHAGSFILAEGQVTEVRDSSSRVSVFFGPRRHESLAVTLMQRNVKIFEAAGLHFHDLIGQTLRVRGLLETRFGPEIEVTHPNDIEIIRHDVVSENGKPAAAAP